MAEQFDLIADYREDQGKGASRRLRHAGRVPAIIYGAGRPPRALSFDHNKVLKQLESESFYSSILNIKVGDKSQAAIVKDIQRHPSKRIIMHLDMQRVVAGEKIKMNVPIHFLNSEDAVGVRLGGGVVSQLINDVEVVCLPKDLPEYFEVDIAALDVDDMLHLSDIKLPEGVEIPELAHGPEHDHAMVAVNIMKAAPIEEDEIDEDAAGDVPTAADEEAAENGDDDQAE